MALQRLKAVCDAGFISVLDFRNNPLKVFAAHEVRYSKQGNSALPRLITSKNLKLLVVVKTLHF